MKLVDVYGEDRAVEVLYLLLVQREPHQNISHRITPSWEGHVAFVASHPYAHWYLIEEDGDFVGATYLTHNDEIGLFILRDERSKGYGTQALDLLRRKHPQPMIANVNPNNEHAIRFWKRHGFVHIQNTYRAE